MDFAEQIDQYAREAAETEEPEVAEPVEDEPEEDADSEDFDTEDIEDPDDEESEEEVEEEEGFDYAGWNPEEWSGRPDDLPPNLLMTYKTMQGGYTKKMQELSQKDRMLNEREQRLFVKEQQLLESQKKVDDPRPANPTEDMTPEQQSQRWDEIMQWNARQAVAQKETPKQDTFDPGQYVVSHPQWNQDVDAKMVEIVNSDPSWREVIKTEAGTDKLLMTAIREMEMEDLKKARAANEGEKIREQSRKAKKRTPATKRKSRAIDTFAAVFDEKDPIKRANSIIEKSMG